MAFEIVKTFVVKASPPAVWEFLTDPYRVAKCLPGAAITEKIDEKTYGGTMTVKVGPVSSSYKGKVVFERLDRATRTAEIQATGQDVRGRGGAELRLKSSVKELGPGESEITAASSVNITGILAQMGRGMIQDVSDQMFQVFSQRVRAELEGASAAPASGAPAAAATPAAGAAPPSAGSAASPPPAAAMAAPGAGEALDLGSLGAHVAGRAAGRALRNPSFWAIVVVLVVLYLLLR
jgi:carbon monoxide dehydrogenase subunit G